MSNFNSIKVLSRVRRKSNTRKIVTFLLAIALLQFAAVEFLLVFSGSSDRITETGYVIILGAGLRGETPSPVLNERLAAGVDYLKKFPKAQAIVSGGQGRGEDITEAEAMRRYLVSNGIAESRILVEDRSTSTMENFKFSKSLIEQKTGHTVRDITFITSNFHVYRSKMLAERNGLRAFVISCKTPISVTIQLHFREYLALFKSLAVDR